MFKKTFIVFAALFAASEMNSQERTALVKFSPSFFSQMKFTENMSKLPKMGSLHNFGVKGQVAGFAAGLGTYAAMVAGGLSYVAGLQVEKKELSKLDKVKNFAKAEYKKGLAIAGAALLVAAVAKVVSNNELVDEENFEEDVLPASDDETNVNVA